jgi:DNA-binding CsgD family transcriptional regulator/tetratricopeptide (TPR) repeat protein
MLLGRSAELAAIDGLLDRARNGEGGALVLCGEPGVGKSALLEYAAGRSDDYRLLAVTGVQTEADLAFSGLHQLFGQHLDRIEALPPPQAEAMRIAFGRAHGAPVDPFLTSLAVLGVLTDLSEEQPLLCIVDDAQWLDEPSQSTLVFAARRVEEDAVLVLAAVREGESSVFTDSSLPMLDVAGLDAEAAGMLLETRGGAPLPAHVRELLLREAAGNPLALLELPASLSDAQLTGRELLSEPLRPAARLHAAYRSQLAVLGPQTRGVLLIAAAEGSGDLPTILRAAGNAAVGHDALGEAERHRIIQTDSERVTFRHPLLRSAVYHDATVAERQTAHRSLATALTGLDDDRCAWHLGLAAEGPDESVASALERSADRASERAGYGAAATVLERAASLSPSNAARGERIVGAARAAWLAGSAERARSLLDDPAVSASGELAIQAASLRGRINIRLGTLDEALSTLIPAVEDVADRDPAIAVQLLIDAEGAALYLGEKQAAIHIGRLAGELIARGTDRRSLRALSGIGLACTHDMGSAVPQLEHALNHDASPDEIDELLLAMQAAVVLGEDVRAVELTLQAVRRARERGALGELPRALEAAAFGELRLGRFSSVVVYAEESRRLALELGHEPGLPICELALVAAIQGREAEARALAADGRRRGHERRSGLLLSLSAWAVGLLELGQGHPDRAEAALRPALPGGGTPSHHLVALIMSPDYVEAAARSGNGDGARGQLEAFERFARDVPLSWADAQVHHCRGVLSAGEESEAHFREAIELHPTSGRAFARARSELALGQLLRRDRQRREARTHLRIALDRFERVGAEPWAETARSELRASGETVKKREPSAVRDLTPQELQIARMAATGARSRQIAAELFLSPRTVDYHLRKVFKKLGISSRTELAAAGALVDTASDR